MDTNAPIGPFTLADDTDLEWNRRGMLSPSQQQMLANMHASGRRHRKVLAVFLLLLPVVVVAYISLTSRAQGFDAGSQPMIAVAAMVPFLLVIALVMVWGGRRSNRLLSGTLYMAEGPVQLIPHGMSPGNHISSTTVVIGDLRYRLLDDDAAAFQMGAWYRAYYVKGETTMVLSFERLG